jgi:hypothetical protein
MELCGYYNLCHNLGVFVRNCSPLQIGNPCKGTKKLEALWL